MKLIPVDPIHLSFRDKFLSTIACFITILLIAWIAQQSKLNTAYPIIVASMGPTALMLFFIPNSPLAQPWPLVAGHLISGIVGVTCAKFVPDIVFAAALAVAGSVITMLLLRCLHPPGTASALAPVLSYSFLPSLGYDYVLVPIGLNMIIMIIVAIVFNRWLLGHEYPTKTRLTAADKNIEAPIAKSAWQPNISEQDVEQVLQQMNTFIDVSSMDLTRLLTHVEHHRFIQKAGVITCADIMSPNCLSVEYGTEVEAAWHLMHKENINALPVIDRSKRVIGIVTWHDFFKFISSNPEQTLQEKILAFIQRTPDVSANKPEAIGQIMTTKVTLLTENTHIAELVPLMAAPNGYRQIPIINSENRLVGMVEQEHLISGLYNKLQ